MRRTTLAAPTLALALAPAAAWASPLADSMASLEPLLGTWATTETNYAPDGTVVEEVEGGIIEFDPELRGTYLLMRTELGHVDPEADPLLWIFCHDAEHERFVAHGFSAGDPAPAEAVGSWKGDKLVFVRAPGTDVPPVEFRFTIHPLSDDRVEVSLEIRLEDTWVLRTEESWRRLE